MASLFRPEALMSPDWPAQCPHGWGKPSHEWATFHREYMGILWEYMRIYGNIPMVYDGLWWFMMVYGISWKSKPSQTIIFSMILAVLPREHFGQSLFLDQLKCLESKKNLWKTWKNILDLSLSFPWSVVFLLWWVVLRLLWISADMAIKKMFKSKKKGKTTINHRIWWWLSQF